MFRFFQDDKNVDSEQISLKEFNSQIIHEHNMKNNAKRINREIKLFKEVEGDKNNIELKSIKVK